ncbi:MAG: hypothetical protein IKR61_08035 [Lachnospiraceae bacterium]|nr:hypothetical protein [Lachnospiraceae bacterium]
MMDESTREKAFGEALIKLRRTARENGGMITKEELTETFAPFSLNDEQMEQVYAYLEQNHIGVDAPPDTEAGLSGEDRAYLETYLESLKELSVLTKEERTALAARAMKGDEQASKALAESLLSTVPDVARLYVEQGVYLEDLIGEGNLALYHGAALLGALEDPEEAETVLTRCVMDAMEAFIAENLEEDARGQHAVNRVNEVADRAKELYEDLRRPVTVEELMHETGWKKEKILEALKLAGGAIEEIEWKPEEGEKNAADPE